MQSATDRKFQAKTETKWSAPNIQQNSSYSLLQRKGHYPQLSKTAIA
jgi:hypothetical protein